MTAKIKRQPVSTVRDVQICVDLGTGNFYYTIPGAEEEYRPSLSAAILRIEDFFARRERTKRMRCELPCIKTERSSSTLTTTSRVFLTGRHATTGYVLVKYRDRNKREQDRNLSCFYVDHANVVALLAMRAVLDKKSAILNRILEACSLRHVGTDSYRGYSTDESHRASVERLVEAHEKIMKRASECRPEAVRAEMDEVDAVEKAV